MNVGIIGVGGVGGYFGGKIARLLPEKAKELHVTFFARGKHLEEISKNGLILSTQNEGEFIVRPTLATNKIDEVPLLDVCLLCVKGYDLQNVLQAIKDKIGPNTHVVPLLNGVDIYDRTKSILGYAVVYPACVYVGTHIERYGKVTQNGGACTILFGKDPSRMNVDPRIVLDLFDLSSIKYKFLDNPAEEIWNKYIFIAAYGMVTASENITLGQVFENPGWCNRVKDIMKEIATIAAKKGVSLSANIVDEAFNKGNNFPHGTKTSFQRDFEIKDKSNESELFGDTIVRLGMEYGVATPATSMINNTLKQMKH